MQLIIFTEIIIIMIKFSSCKTKTDQEIYRCYPSISVELSSSFFSPVSSLPALFTNSHGAARWSQGERFRGSLLQPRQSWGKVRSHVASHALAKLSLQRWSGAEFGEGSASGRHPAAGHVGSEAAAGDQPERHQPHSTGSWSQTVPLATRTGISTNDGQHFWDEQHCGIPLHCR